MGVIDAWFRNNSGELRKPAHTWISTRVKGIGWRFYWPFVYTDKIAIFWGIGLATRFPPLITESWRSRQHTRNTHRLHSGIPGTGHKMTAHGFHNVSNNPWWNTCVKHQRHYKLQSVFRGKLVDPVGISRSSRYYANCEIIKLQKGIFVTAIGMSAQVFQGICEVFGINVGKEQHIRPPGPHCFQNLIGTHDWGTK